VSPSTVALGQSVEGLLMAIVGGIGTLFGAFVGAATIIVLENAVSAYTERWPTALGITFIAIMIFAPQGIVGTKDPLAHYRSIFVLASWIARFLAASPAEMGRNSSAWSASKKIDWPAVRFSNISFSLSASRADSDNI
jgi:hypothetical protein